jgi:hypothetical protein
MGNSNSNLTTQPTEETLVTALVGQDVRFDRLPNEIIEYWIKGLPLNELLNVRSVNGGLLCLISRLSVESSNMCCLSHPFKHAPSFADDIKSSLELLSFSWKLRQNPDLPLDENTAYALLQMFTVELQSEISQDQVRCIFVHSSDHRRRGQRLFEQDSLPELTPVFSIIAEFKNLKSLALSRFKVSVNLRKQLEKLDLQALYLIECNCLGSGGKDADTTDLRGFTNLRKLQLTPIRGFRWNTEAYLLPPQLKELELSIPESIAACKIEIYAIDCENLERM